MAVPKTGKFKMFGTGSIFHIEGAVSSSVVTYINTESFSGSNSLIDQSISTKFDLDEVPGQVLTNNINISESIQFRGYPIVDNFTMTAKCIYTSSFTISGSTPPPPDDETYMCLEYISGTFTLGFNGVTNGWIPSNPNITGSDGFGDTSWPISSSYDYVRLSHRNNLLHLVIDQNGLNETPPTFTSLTISSPGKTDLVLDYCDLNSSSSIDDYYSYFWNTSDPNNHFTDGNCITASYDTTTVDYYVDCDPAITTTPVTITIGNAAISKQQSCDANTTSTVYMTPTDLTNGLTVGDYVYETSDGRNPFDGESKFWGINTSSAPTLNEVPDKIVQISSNGYITTISDCTQTPPYEPSLDPASRDCNSTDANPSGVITNENANFNAGEYDVHQIGSTSEVTQSFLWVSYDRPNKFTLYDDSSTFADPIYSTGWVGKSTYANAAGKDQWTVPLNTAPSGSQTIIWGSTAGRKVRVDYGYNNGTLSDAAVFSLICTSSLQPLNVSTGSTVALACGGDYDDDIHYHFHTTGSGDFSENYQPFPYSLSGTHITNRGRVFKDTSGLNVVEKDLTKWISYSSSEGTRYRYMVIDDYNSNMGSIAYHNRCPGELITAIRLMAAGTDCDDVNTGAISNRLFISTTYGGIDLVNGIFKIDNDNLTISNQIEIDLYDNDPSDSNISPNSIDKLNPTVFENASSNTFLVSDDSLKNPTGTKVLATVTAGTPATVSFTPCSNGGSPPPDFGGGGCTRVYVSTGFTSTSFSGDDPTISMCNPSTWASYNAAIDIAGLQVAAGDDFYTNLACTGGSNYGNTYFTIYEPIQGSTFIIRMNDTDGTEIKQVWTCGAGDVETSGSNDYFLSTPFTDYGNNCGQNYQVSTSVTSDAGTIAIGLGYVVYANGARFNGNNKYFIVKTSSQQADGDEGDSHRFWQIDRNGVVQDVAIFTCGGDGGSE